MKRFTLYFLLAASVVTFVAGTASASEIKMTFTGSADLPNSRVWLPCSFGSCMIDLGGDGSITNLNSFSETLSILKVTAMNSVSGQQFCYLVLAPEFQLAEKVFTQMTFHRCDWFPANNSPMLGLDYFRGKKFAFTFSSGVFSWLERDIQEPKVKLFPLGPWLHAWLGLGPLQAQVVIDTGAPLTLVDKEFVQKNPDFFEVSKDLPNRAKLKMPISIEGIEFSGRDVMVYDLKGSFGPQAPNFFLGMNHIQEADWEFDYKTPQVHFKLIPSR